MSKFSGLNNLNDITLDKRYSALCGYTDYDIDTVFAPELAGLDREEIRAWYNGYHWLGEGVYNPFDILLLFSNRKFKNYWFETGTPTFLIQALQKAKVMTPRLNQLLSNDDLLSSFDIDNMAIEALMVNDFERLQTIFQAFFASIPHLYLIGVEFSQASRNVVGFEVEQYLT